MTPTPGAKPMTDMKNEAARMLPNQAPSVLPETLPVGTRFKHRNWPESLDADGRAARARSAYTFPGRNGWRTKKDLTFTHTTGARVWHERFEDGAGGVVVEWFAMTAAGERRGPFWEFGEALRGAVCAAPVVESLPAQLELPFARCA